MTLQEYFEYQLYRTANKCNTKAILTINEVEQEVSVTDFADFLFLNTKSEYEQCDEYFIIYFHLDDLTAAQDILFK